MICFRTANDPFTGRFFVMTRGGSSVSWYIIMVPLRYTRVQVSVLLWISGLKGYMYTRYKKNLGENWNPLLKCFSCIPSVHVALYCIFFLCLYYICGHILLIHTPLIVLLIINKYYTLKLNSLYIFIFIHVDLDSWETGKKV